jgi:hypothetical protein
MDDLEVRQERAARNQMLFRSVNERIDDIAAAAFHDGNELDFICECADTECTETIALTLPEFQAIRSIENQFVIRRGHELPEVEDVTAKRDGYVIVAKRGAAEEYVREHS